MKTTIEFTLTSAIFIIFLTVAQNAQIASGGIYALDQAVIASGGGASSEAVNNYKVEGSGGQPAAGTFASSGVYSARGGFWAPGPLAPTAAGVSIGGRVTGIGGEGLRNVKVFLTGGTLLTPRQARTGSFGHFRFEDVESGHLYIITVQDKRHGFSQNALIISLTDSISEIIFQAAWEN